MWSLDEGSCGHEQVRNDSVNSVNWMARAGLRELHPEREGWNSVSSWWHCDQFYFFLAQWSSPRGSFDTLLPQGHLAISGHICVVVTFGGGRICAPGSRDTLFIALHTVTVCWLGEWLNKQVSSSILTSNSLWVSFHDNSLPHKVFRRWDNETKIIGVIIKRQYEQKIGFLNNWFWNCQDIHT